MEADFPLLEKAREVTRRPESKAPRNAQRFTGEIILKILIERIVLPPALIKILAITAPRVAPELIPIMPGSARGFRKNN